MNTVKNCAKSDMMNDALKHYDEAGRAINHWRSDIYEAIKAYYSESNQLESESPRPVEDGKPYWVIERKCEHCFEWYNELDKNWYNDIHKATKFEKQEYAGHVFVLKAGIGLEHSYVAEHNGTSNGWQYEKCRIK